MRACAVEGCGREHEARGWCHGHFERQRRGDPVGGPFLETPIERFEDKYEVDESGCWIWTAATDGDGRYGAFYNSDTERVERAHRWRYEQSYGPVSDALDLDHLCRTTLCVNPRHLEPVTHTENLLRGEGFGAKNARKTACHRGHPFDAANTIKRANGHRACRTCADAHNRAHYLGRKYGIDLSVDDVLLLSDGEVRSSRELLDLIQHEQAAASSRLRPVRQAARRCVASADCVTTSPTPPACPPRIGCRHDPRLATHPHPLGMALQGLTT